MNCNNTSTECKQLYHLVINAQNNAQTIHQAACKNLPAGQHAPQCNQAYAYFHEQTTKWRTTCCH